MPAGQDYVGVNCGLGAYWCPGQILTSPIPKPNWSDQYFEPSQYGYHGGEVEMAEAAYAIGIEYFKLDRAAMAAEKEALKLTQDLLNQGIRIEHGGLIIRNDKDGTLKYLKPIAGEERTVDLDSIRVPAGYTVIGEYHTHPHVRLVEGEGPSPGDIFRLQAIARNEHMERIGYVATTYTGDVYRYTRFEPVQGWWDATTYGTKIGTIPLTIPR